MERLSDEEAVVVLGAPIRLNNLASDVHLLPQDDWFEHYEDVNCACNPRLDIIGIGDIKEEIWVHTCIRLQKEDLA